MSVERSHDDRVNDVLSFIVNHINYEHFPPTIREIGEATEIPSTSHVDSILGQLSNEGVLVRESGSRAMRVVMKPSPIELQVRKDE